MADVTSQALVPPPTALFPQPPQQQQGLGSNPSQMLDLLAKVQQNYALQQELKARAAVGQAYQGALQPDGSFDPNRLASGLRNPDASWALPETMSRVLQQQGQQFEVRAKQNQFLIDGLGALADKPNLSREDVYHFVTTAARAANIPSDVLIGWMGNLPSNPKALRDALQTTRSMAIGSAGLAGRVAGQPTPAGAPTTESMGQTIFSGGQSPGGGGGPGMPVGLPPGVATRQEGAAGTDVRLADALSHEAEGSQQRRALLGNIMDLSDKFTPGPGANESKVAKSFINRNIPLPEGWKFDQKSIADQEEFAKQAAQFAQRQFDTIGGTGTDAKFNSAFTVSPNEAMSKLGIKGVSRLLLGNEDAIQAKNKAWLDASAADPNLSYRRFSQDFQSHFDPRVFQFKYVPGKERQDYFDKMEPQDQARLLHDMTYARKQGWVSYGEGSAAPAKSAPPLAPAPPVPGARPGRHTDGRQGWFISDPDRPGKYLAVAAANSGNA